MNRRTFFAALLGLPLAARIDAIPAFTAGSSGFLDFGAGTWVMLHGPEVILAQHPDGSSTYYASLDEALRALGWERV